ncbi:hypothetical protein G3480_21870 [Thiorhodococcus mannitoliphagus]|uniref:Uncharacterized protein n=1 Tax=Thiorhodococcus mannitoliphagus TaxID=329406 RepID=A0A6P1E1H5_9GAMM|nr:hypothetical protein [Thiorhodococcus mannitoliphagus]NEX22916.1 hypothetical protein [Thiorhodococcus mannitoliphagus]
MSWITVIWSMAAGISLTLAAVNLLVWLRDRDAVANALFSVSAVAAAVLAMQELAVMRAQTPAEFGAILRWRHLSAAVIVIVIVIAVVWFTQLYLGAGRRWLAWLHRPASAGADTELRPLSQRATRPSRKSMPSTGCFSWARHYRCQLHACSVASFWASSPPQWHTS